MGETETEMAEGADAKAPSVEVFEQLKLEYEALRKEIEAAKGREFSLLVGGLVAIPAASEWIRQSLPDNKLSFLILCLPLAVSFLAMAVSAIRRSAMRCGAYIHAVLEPHFQLTGWETWLEALPARRLPEILLATAFSILLVGYYLIAAFIAARHAYQLLGTAGLYASIVAYLILGVVTVFFSWTPTRHDKGAEESQPSNYPLQRTGFARR
jgi:hypothetical protein